jgi:hypothetical protein
LVALNLNRDVNDLMGEVQDVFAGELSARLTSLHQQGQLFEGLFGAAGVDAGDGNGAIRLCRPYLTL